MVFLLFLLSACETASVKDSQVSPSLIDAAADPSVERRDTTFIVDCLLPGKIKKLGSSFTYLTPRRPVKASALECEIRGGEYVAYDRANYKTALKVWQPLADEGDMVAQTYVGAIFEKGLGVDPDYQQAAVWYEKAATQGYARAQFSLGYLYETGLGVEKNPQKAFQLYRQASGLDGKDLGSQRLALAEQEKQKLAQAAEAERALLAKIEQQVEERKGELSDISVQLHQAKLTVNQERNALRNAQQGDLQQLDTQLDERRRQASELDAQLVQKRTNLAQVEETLAQQKQVAATRGAELDALVNDIERRKEALQAELSQLARAKQDVDRQRATSTGQQEEGEQLNAQAEILTAEVAAKQGQLAEVERALATQKALAEDKGAELLTLLKDVEGRQTTLNAELAELEKSRAELRRNQQEVERQRTATEQEWQRERQRHVAELSRQQEIIAQLETVERQNKEKLAYLNRAQHQKTLALVAPRIEIIDPQVPMVRSASPATPVFSVHSGVAEREVVGKVISENDLLLLTLNDRKLPVSTNGLFKAAVSVEDAGTLVDVVAVDVGGNRGETKFVLAPAKQLRNTVTSGDSVQAKPAKPILPPDIEFGDYYALLIGNNEYEFLPKLLTPINDIEATAAILRNRYGFKETITLKNASRYDIITAFNTLRKSLSEKDNLLVYYAGHGELDRINMTGQWLPVDAETENTANWISNSALTELINAMSAKHVLVVADSCYSGILTRSALVHIDAGESDDARTAWLRKMAKKRSRTVLTSGGVAPVLDEGGGKHSIFARAFLQALEDNIDILEGQRLFRRVSATVTLAADRYRVEQVPEYAPIRHAGHESGDFFFVPKS